MKQKIRKVEDPILRQTTDEIVDFDLELEHLLDDMVETMRTNKGIGLAAPQIGQSKKAIVIEFAGDKESKIEPIPLTILCNPEIVSKSKSMKNMVEGCLSFPGLEILVKRPGKVTVKGQDRYGKPLEIEANKLFARVLQHEIDHLNGILLIDHIQKIKTMFIGTGTLGVPSLKALAKDPQYEISLVITGKSESVSRKEKVNPIYETAKSLNLPILVTENINDENVIEKIKAGQPEIGIMADFGQIIKKEVLDIPKFGIINIHPSLLPRHRGPSPIQQTILDGDKLTGITLIKTGERMDAGDIISQASAELSGSETTEILKDYLADAGATLILNSVPYYIAGDLPPEAQDESKATYNRLFKKEDGFVDASTKQEIVERKIRAFSVWPKVYTLVNDRRVQLLAAHFDPENNLIIDRVKPEGKKEMSYDEFVRGYRVKLTFPR